ncbi:hypothetical protein EDB89DRAFT_2236104 [Lactarius sanguifluus]|nr:hypothetical protein EDB89DRAFT_2236104 [Lactarius sanguifluus]
MYYDDEDDDDDPYAPRIGPAAMPSPRSKFAPYYSGHANTFEDFLEEYEGLAYDCALTDPQRVDVLIRYVAPSLRDFWRSLSGYHSRDWPLFRQSLVNIFGSTTPRPQVMRQRLLNYVQDSSRCRMLCEDDVLRYYRQFLCYSAPLVHAGHLSEEERDAAFWYGFHPDDCQVLRPRLLGKNPFQPPDIPFHFEVVFSCARAAFAYDDYFPSPWSHAKQFESPSFRRVVEPIPRDSYSFREVTHVAATYTETTLETTPNEPFPSSHSTPDPQLPSSSSPSVLESQHGLVHSVTLDQPEPTFSTLSTTFLPSASEAQLEPFPAPTFPITRSTLLPSVSPTPAHDSLLAHSAADVPEISSTPLSSPTLAPFSMPITSDVEYLSSATVDQPAPTLLPSIPTLPITPLHVHSAINSSTSMPSSLASSTFLPSPVTSATDCQPKSEPASASESPVSKFSLFPRMLSLPPDQTLAPLSSSPLREISSLGSLPVAPSPDQPSLSLVSLSQLSRSCELESSTPVSAADVVTLSHPELPLSSPGNPIPFLSSSLDTPPNAPISPCSTLPQRPPGLKTIGSVSTRLEVTPAPAPPATPFVSQSQQPLLVYEVSSTLAAPRFSHTPTPRLQSGFSFARLTLALSFVSIVALVSVLLNVSKIPSTHERKMNKIKDLGSTWNKTRNAFAHRLRLGKFTPRAARFVFDPGGPASSFKLLSAHEDIRQRKSKTRNGLHHMHDTSLPTPVPINNPVFDPGGVAFV